MDQKEKNFYTKKSVILIVAVIANALWGSAFPAIKTGYEVFRITNGSVADKLVFAGIRFIFAGLLVTLFNFISKRSLSLPKKKDIKGIVLLAMVQTWLEYIFFYISLTNLSGVKGSIINSMGNFFAVLIAAVFLKNDKMTLPKTLGCILGFAGIVICNSAQTIDSDFSLTGEGFMLLAAFCFASGAVITKVFAQNTEPAVLTGFQLMLGGLLLLISGIVFGGSVTFYGIDCALSITYLALLSAIAFTLWAKLLKYNPVGKISLFGFLNPIFGVILSGIILGEDFLNIRLILALFLVSAGIYTVNYANIKTPLPNKKQE
ncbi:MAG: DMT family transporter [Firmicutes bacterium]|nr:DMT family transporter [Bacillota bacterium]